MKVELSELIRAFQYMYPSYFVSYQGDPIDVLKEHGKDFLSDHQFEVWSRAIMGGEKGIHLSDNGDSFQSK